MATSPAFANVPIVGTGLAPATADTSLTAPTNATTLSFSTAVGSAGAKIEEIRFSATATSVAGIINLFLHDGSTYHLIDEIATSAVTLSTTAPSWETTRRYTNLWIPNPGTAWSLRFAVSIAGLQSIIKLVAFGANL